MSTTTKKKSTKAPAVIVPTVAPVVKEEQKIEKPVARSSSPTTPASTSSAVSSSAISSSVPKNTNIDDKYVLSRSMRPMSLDDIIGQDANINFIKRQFESGRLPHFFIIGGSFGTGKTSIARIIAMMIQGLNSYTPNDLKNYDISEINGADKNGIETIRSLIEEASYFPRLGSKAKVVIIDEAQQLTRQAQDALLKPAEEPHDKFFLIFSTSDVSKIADSLKRRATIIRMDGLDNAQILDLLERAKERTGCQLDSEPLLEALINREVREPGKILQAYEKYVNGIDATNCVMETAISNAGLDEKKLVAHIKKGNWLQAVEFLKLVKKDEVFGLKIYITNSLKNMILTEPNDDTVKTSLAILHIINSKDDLPSFVASVRLAINEIRPVVYKKKEQE